MQISRNNNRRRSNHNEIVQQPEYKVGNLYGTFFDPFSTLIVLKCQKTFVDSSLR